MSPIVNFKLHWFTKTRINNKKKHMHGSDFRNQNTSDPIVEKILKMDLSPLDINEINKRVAHKVNCSMGIKDGGNTNIARGRVIYPDEQNERRLRVLKFSMSK